MQFAMKPKTLGTPRHGESRTPLPASRPPIDQSAEPHGEHGDAQPANELAPVAALEQQCRMQKEDLAQHPFCRSMALANVAGSTRTRTASKLGASRSGGSSRT